MMTRERINELAKKQREEVEAICQDRDDISAILQLLLPVAEHEKAIKFSTELTIIHGTLLACADEENINYREFVHQLFTEFEDDGYGVYRIYIMDSLEAFCDGIEDEYNAFQMLTITMKQEVMGE